MSAMLHSSTVKLLLKSVDMYLSAFRHSFLTALCLFVWSFCQGFVDVNQRDLDSDWRRTDF